MQLLRFTNSGTEANLMALTAARVISGKQTVLAFGGAYHAPFLAFPSDRSIATNVPFKFVVGTYNDAEGARSTDQGARRRSCGVIVEPMLGAGGCIPASELFLMTLRQENRADRFNSAVRRGHDIAPVVQRTSGKDTALFQIWSAWENISVEA